MAFSLYEMRIVLASILARTELRPAPGPPIHVVRRGITMSASGGMPLIMERRWERGAAGRPV
jgi:cytochrome P450